VASVVTALAVVLGGWASPASADPVVVPRDFDAFIMVSPQVDFGGGNLNIYGQPSHNGHMWWMQELYDPAVVWPNLVGRLFINNSAGMCARMQLVYHDRNNDHLATRNGGTVCSPDNRANSWTVNLMPYGNDDIDHVHVNLQTVGVNGAATTVNTSVRFVP
jgi:hypothetical protein